MRLPKQAKRDKVLTVRITAEAIDRLAKLAAKANMSQADAVEFWIDLAWKAERYRPRPRRK
jgi:hypothetical protein